MCLLLQGFQKEHSSHCFLEKQFHVKRVHVCRTNKKKLLCSLNLQLDLKFKALFPLEPFWVDCQSGAFLKEIKLLKILDFQAQNRFPSSKCSIQGSGCESNSIFFWWIFELASQYLTIVYKVKKMIKVV